jgi:hypothetical protein
MIQKTQALPKPHRPKYSLFTRLVVFFGDETIILSTITELPPTNTPLLETYPEGFESETLTLAVDPTTIIEYRYSIDGMPYTSPIATNIPITLSGLSIGEHTLKLVGKSTNGLWQSINTPTMYTLERKESEWFRTRHEYSPENFVLIEVSIDEQHLWYFEGDEVVFHSPVTTGMWGMQTEKGIFSITEKKIGKVFEGGYYSEYWMRINGGIGIHDATWRDDFGELDYLNYGSHGCVNTPTDTAKWIFEHSSLGTAVHVY